MTHRNPRARMELTLAAGVLRPDLLQAEQRPIEIQKILSVWSPDPQTKASAVVILRSCDAGGIIPWMNWAHIGPTILASFLASLVEFVEALTVVLAVGSVRGWRSAVAGSAAAVAILLALIAGLGRTLTRVPLHTLQLVVGILLLLFGLRWLRKAILRSSGHIPLHDEGVAFQKNAASMRATGKVQGWDRVAFASAFQITMLEGTEVVFIVVAIGAGGVGLLLPASLGAVAALLLVIGLGFALHRPLANVPENKLKFVVGVLLSAFGTFWVGEGVDFIWPGGDWCIAALIAGYLLVALITVALCGRGVNATVLTSSNEGVVR